MSPIADAVRLLRGLYLEMPGSCFTPGQLARLSGLDVETCDAVLAGLTDARFLRRSSRGAFVRATDGPALSH